MKCFIVLILLFFIVNIVKTDGNVNSVGYLADLTGDQVVPKVNTESHGTAELGLDLVRNTLIWNITIFGISQSEITGASVCGPASAGENAPSLFSVDISLTTTADTTIVISGSQVLLNDPSIISSLNVGRLYLIIETQQYPQGELRGQIQTTSNKFSATLSPQLVSPPVNSNANGFAVIHLNYNALTMNLDLQHTCENVTDIHIHAPETMNSNGPILFSFKSQGSKFQMVFNITKTDSDYLRDGEMSLDIHTVQFPQGEVRGTFLVDLVEDQGDPNKPDGPNNNNNNNNDDHPPHSSTSKNTSLFIIIIVSLLAIIVLMAFVMLTIIVLTNFRKTNLPSLKRKNKKNRETNHEDVEALVEEENL